MQAATILANRTRVGLRLFTATLMVGIATVCTVGVSSLVGEPAQATTLPSCGTGTLTSLLPRFDEPYGIAVSGSDLFVANYGSNTVGEYTTSGATVNASLVTGMY